ncbi:MAG: hypothetical protein DCC47_16005 [Acidobacteria bacterium]|nr:MAG: hypothetical protein DCC47_16005 [Acidobacteriota bacterium]
MIVPAFVALEALHLFEADARRRITGRPKKEKVSADLPTLSEAPGKPKGKKARDDAAAAVAVSGRLVRKVQAVLLTRAGLSTRAVGEALGYSEAQVRNDVHDDISAHLTEGLLLDALDGLRLLVGGPAHSDAASGLGLGTPVVRTLGKLFRGLLGLGLHSGLHPFGGLGRFEGFESGA